MIKVKNLCEHYSKIIIWGAGSAFSKYYQGNMEIAYVVDSNEKLWGTRVCDILIQSPSTILKENIEQTALVICSQYEDDISQNARKMGIKCDIYFSSMLYPNPFQQRDYYSLPEFIEDVPFTCKYTDEKNSQILIALLKAHKIRKVIASPGGTNFCFLASIQNDPFFEIYSCSDERSAAYMACGLAEESGEPVVINCTGATASRNYLPGLTEAFYRKLPILAVTCSQHLGKIGQNSPQVTDRVTVPTDVANLSVQLPMVTTAQDKWSCEIHVNMALLELTRRGGGPVHINLMTGFSTVCSVHTLPSVQVIRRVCYNDTLPELRNGKIGIFVGAHKKWSKQSIKAVEEFCQRFNAVVICDQTSNYRGKYHVMAPLILTQEQCNVSFDLLIYVGDISGAYMRILAKQIWRVNPDGEVRDTYGKTRYVFEMNEEDFFESYNRQKSEKIYFGTEPQNVLFQRKYMELYKLIPELPFTNMWIAKKTASCIPDNSTIYFGILNSLRSWNFFELPETTVAYANTGGFGIEGGMSSLIGVSLANPLKLCFGIFGDLGFFSDMNVLGNRHIRNNVRIMIVNNGAGAEFYSKYSQCILVYGDDKIGEFCAADGHYGQKSRNLVKDYAENLGFDYMSASNKAEYLGQMEYFVKPKIGEKPIIFEIFTNCEEEAQAREMLQTIEKNNELR